MKANSHSPSVLLTKIIHGLHQECNLSYICALQAASGFFVLRSVAHTGFETAHFLCAWPVNPLNTQSPAAARNIADAVECTRPMDLKGRPEPSPKTGPPADCGLLIFFKVGV